MSDAIEWTQREAAWVAQVDEGVDVPEEIVLPDGVKLVSSPGDEDWVGYGFEDVTGHRWMLMSTMLDGNQSEWIVEASQAPEEQQ